MMMVAFNVRVDASDGDGYADDDTNEVKDVEDSNVDAVDGDVVGS